MLLNDDITKGVLGRKRKILTLMVGKPSSSPVISYPPPVMSYARGLAAYLGEPLEKVLKSKAVKTYARRYK